MKICRGIMTILLAGGPWPSFVFGVQRPVLKENRQRSFLFSGLM